MFLLYNRPSYTVGVTLVASIFLAAPQAFADPLPSYEILVEQLGQSPQSQEASALYDAAEARVMQARARPNPSLTLETENAYGSGPYSRFNRADSTLSINQPLEIWGQREARIGAAHANVTVASLRREQTDKTVAAQLALAYANAEAALMRDELSQEALILTQQEADAARALVDQGRAPRLRLIQAESEVASAQAQQVEAQSNREAALARLGAFIPFDKIASSIPNSLLDRLPQALRPSLADPLPVRVAQAEREAAEQLVVMEKVRARPDLSASFGVRRFEETGDRALSFGINLSIPIFDRNQGAIRAAEAEQRAAEARLRASRLEALAEHQAAQASLIASDSWTRAALTGMAAAEEAYRMSRIGFEAGRLSQLELRSARTALISARYATIDARYARVRAEVELARLEGRIPFRTAP